MNNKKNQINLLLLALSVLSFLTLNILDANANDSEDFDSVIVRPSQKVQKLKRQERLMYRRGVRTYYKINENLFLIPLSAENKSQQIDQLKKAGLFDLVEPDYKLSIDQVESKNYISVTKNSTFNNFNIPDSSAPDVTPNDSDFKSQYYLKTINAPKAWGSADYSNSVIVAVLDTGVDASHPDLNGHIIGNDLTDSIGHGTEVSGIIAANSNNNQGITGISWNTNVISIMITDDNGQARVSSVVAGLDEAYKRGARVVQISLSTNQYSYSLRDAVKLAQDRGLLIISSAGNSGINELRYPSAFENVIGVGAVDKDKNLEYYSTTGGHVSLVAPGSSILTTTLDSKYEEVTGTSFSAPQVSGTAALVLSAVPTLSADDLRRVLLLSADDLGDSGRDDDFGYGLLNAKKAVEFAKSLAE